jgi:hypothetical protein
MHAANNNDNKEQQHDVLFLPSSGKRKRYDASFLSTIELCVAHCTMTTFLWDQPRLFPSCMPSDWKEIVNLDESTQKRFAKRPLWSKTCVLSKLCPK